MRLLFYDSLYLESYDIKVPQQIYLANKPYHFEISKKQELYQIKKIEDNHCQLFDIKPQQIIQIDEVLVQFITKPNSFTRYALKEQIIIGRDYSCDIVYLHHFISKQHASIYEQEGKWYVQDLESKNGVYVNGKRIQKQQLVMGDLISLVGYEIYFSEIFLYISHPEKCQLSLFQALYLDPNPHIETTLCLLEEKHEPILQLPTHYPQKFSLFSDLLTPLVYPLVLLFQKQVNYFIYVSLLLLLLRWLEKISQWIGYLFKNRKIWKLYQKDRSEYLSYLELRFPPADVLKTLSYIHAFNEDCVRIGHRDRQIIVHDFKKYPTLALIGDFEKVKLLLISIVYQIERFYPYIQVKTKPIIEELILIKSRYQEGDISLGIQNNQGDYQIDYYDSLELCQGMYSALLNVDEGWYYTKQKIPIEMERLDDLYLVSHYFQSIKQTQQTLGLMDLIGNDISHMRLHQQIETSLKGILGYENEHIHYLDLHEQQQGPHLLVAGMSGSGKSEWLTSYLLSLACFYDTCDVQFFMIDFKGGALCALFEKLHHTCMVLSNLDDYQIHRAIAALEDELRVREQLLLQVSQELNEPILDIHQLKKVYKQHKTNKNLAHLMIVIDEFAELKLLYPQMMQALVRISRTGRSLGIHLILCTQRPSGIVDRQIESNIQTKLSLRVASKEDSYDVIGNDHAYHLKKAGHWICKRGSEETVGLVAWVEKQDCPLAFYDLDFHQQFSIPLKQSSGSMKLSLISKINGFTTKANQLYYRSIEEVKFEEDYFGIYDDYMHRQMIPFQLSLSHLIIGGEIAKDGLNQKAADAFVMNKEWQSKEMILFFDVLAIERILMKKVSFKIEKEKGIGAIYYQGELYQCKIRYGVT